MEDEEGIERKPQKRVNYTKEEKADLLNLIKKYPVLFRKRTDAKGTIFKRNAWKKVANEFNSMEGHLVMRTEEQLKKLWENTKNEYKKNLTIQKQETVKPEGGFRNSTYVDDTHLELLFNSVTVEMNNGATDSDTFALMASRDTYDSASEQAIPTSKENVPVFVSTDDDVYEEDPVSIPENPSTRSALSTARSATTSPITPNVGIARFLSNSSRDITTPLQDDIHTSFLTEENDIRAIEEDVEMLLDSKDDVSSGTRRNNPKRTREVMIEDLIYERKRLLNIQHEWKKTEHELKKQILTSKMEAMKAKQKYYESKYINNCK